jgi:hypothetical protein
VGRPLRALVASGRESRASGRTDRPNRSQNSCPGSCRSKSAPWGHAATFGRWTSVEAPAPRHRERDRRDAVLPKPWISTTAGPWPISRPPGCTVCVDLVLAMIESDAGKDLARAVAKPGSLPSARRRITAYIDHHLQSAIRISKRTRTDVDCTVYVQSRAHDVIPPETTLSSFERDC